MTTFAMKCTTTGLAATLAMGLGAGTMAVAQDPNSVDIPTIIRDLTEEGVGDDVVEKGFKELLNPSGQNLKVLVRV